MPVDKMDELLLSVYVVETGSWCISMGKMNKVLKQSLNSGGRSIQIHHSQSKKFLKGWKLAENKQC